MPLPVFTAQDICRQAMFDAGVLAAGAPIKGDQTQDVLNVLNRVLDNLNANQRMAYAEVQVNGVLTPNLNPHLIGPGGSAAGFIITQRPESVERANIIDTSVSPNSYIPVDVVDYRWQASQSVPTITNLISTTLYYEKDWPNGKLYLWPVPTAAYTLNLWTRNVLAQLLATDTFSLPPAYWDYIVSQTAIKLCPMYEQTPSQDLRQAARDAFNLIYDSNIMIPNIATRDAGMPNGQGGRSAFNYQTGLYNGGSK